MRSGTAKLSHFVNKFKGSVTDFNHIIAV